MTVRVGTSIVAGSGADAQEVNSLIESVNALTAKVEELTKKIESGSLGGSGSSGPLSETVKLALIFSHPQKVIDDKGNLELDSEYTYVSSGFVSNNRAYLNVNGVNYYNQLVGRAWYDNYAPRDAVLTIEVPRGELIVVEAKTCIRSSSSSSVTYLYAYNTQACVADTHKALVLYPIDKNSA